MHTCNLPDKSFFFLCIIAKMVERVLSYLVFCFYFGVTRQYLLTFGEAIIPTLIGRVG